MRGLAPVVALALLVTLAGCGEEPVSAPTTQDMKAQRDALAAKIAAKQESKATPEAAAQPAAAAGERTDFAGGGLGYIYDPTGKRDPFRSFRWERLKDVREEDSVGPLEQFELEQLAVSAVIWATGRPRALIEDPAGRAYIVQEGTRIGKNEGLVIHIGDNLVLVKETYVDFAGEQTTKDVELTVRRSQGG